MATQQIRPIRIEGNIAYVPLTQGYEAVIDAADVPLVSGYNWSALVKRRKDGSIWSVYASRREGDCGKVYMHRVIARTAPGMETDHKDGDGLNNQRANLRNATKSRNQHNARISVANTSGVKGVSWHKPSGKWVARIMAEGKMISLGYFLKVEDASAAYAAASAKVHGEFGRIR